MCIDGRVGSAAFVSTAYETPSAWQCLPACCPSPYRHRLVWGVGSARETCVDDLINGRERDNTVECGIEGGRACACVCVCATLPLLPLLPLLLLLLLLS